MKFAIAFALLFLSSIQSYSAPAAADPLRRDNPRAAVTAFLEACHGRDYDKAAQYLDLSRIPSSRREVDGPQLAKDLESLLNSTANFDVLRLSQDPQGDLTDDANPSIEHVTTIKQEGEPFTIELQRDQPAGGAAVWVFSANTVARIPEFMPVANVESKFEARLPRFFVTQQPLDTPLWKWIGLLLLAAVLLVLFRILVAIFDRAVRWLPFAKTEDAAWIPAIADPFLVLFNVALFRFFEELLDPSALTRLYVGRFLLLVVVASLAWGAINLLDYLMVRLDLALSKKTRVVSSSAIYLGRRFLKTIVVIFAAILVFDNWGFNMTTVIAGLGVGGIAVALAAQQTIANVFGGVSVIGDAPVALGDYGNFGGVTGTVEQIGLRSARIRTLNRTLVSIPNSIFAGVNLENFALRDKMLFNPNFPIKRSTPKDQIRRLFDELQTVLKANQKLEVGPAPVRITGYAAAAFTVEIFAYVRTQDIDEYYKHQVELYLAIDDAVVAAGVELA